MTNDCYFAKQINSFEKAKNTMSWILRTIKFFFPLMAAIFYPKRTKTGLLRF